MSDWKYPICAEVRLVYQGEVRTAIVVAHLEAKSNWKSFSDLRLATEGNKAVAIEWLRQLWPSISEEGAAEYLKKANLRPLKFDRYLVWIGDGFRCPKKSKMEEG